MSYLVCAKQILGLTLLQCSIAHLCSLEIILMEKLAQY